MPARRRVDAEHESLPWIVRCRSHVKGECILWEGCTTRADGRQPRFRDGDGLVKTVHRAVWEAVRGTIPPGMLIVRVCGNGLCIRPRHLALMSPSKRARLRSDTT